jgi:glycosyltransferase involved in cell wall biosynthesis
MTIGDLKSHDDPLVTIAIPTYNRADLLKKCVTAAMAQSYQRFEILVSDNASTDHTIEALKSFDDSRLRVLRQESNIGLVPNWNACIAQAKGEYIVFVSDDDWIAPWLLDRCIDVVRAEPGISIVMALSDVSFSSGYKLRAIVSDALGTGVWNGTDILNEVLDGVIFAPMCTILLRTELLRARSGFPTDWGPHTLDKAVWVPLLLSGRAGLVNECCGTQGMHELTVTSGLAIDVIVRDIWKIVELIADVANRKIIDSEKRLELEWRARRYFARCTIGLISSRRRRGTTLVHAVSIIWRWRRELAGVRICDWWGLARPLANILLPRAMVRMFSVLRGRRGLEPSY